MAEVRAKMWPASTKIGLEAVMGTKWREAAERAAGIGSIAQSEAAARTPIRADAGPEVLAALIALAWFATLVGYWLDELNRQGVSLAEVGRFELLAGVAFMIETTRWVYLRAVRILRQH
jgi:hypothetical protein